jgi:hypothetical protein
MRWLVSIPRPAAVQLSPKKNKRENKSNNFGTGQPLP